MVAPQGGRGTGDRGVALFPYVLAIFAVAMVCLAALDAFGGDVASLNQGNAGAISTLVK
jgi:hypothetical protein